jgi:lipoprotein-releasing system ATP-binding protein
MTVYFSFYNNVAKVKFFILVFIKLTFFSLRKHVLRSIKVFFQYLWGQFGSTKMIKAKGIKKNYGHVKVLDGVDLEIDQGNIVSILGKSGAGKSTLLHIMGTLDIADSGQVWIDDVEVSQQSESKLAKFRNSNLGFIFQFHHLLNEFTALENVSIPALIKDSSDKTITARAKEVLDYLGLGHRLSHKPNELSGGEQQRVAVCRALINNPKVIFADEPSGNLDTKNAKELHELFFQLRDEFNQTFVIVTHNEELAQMADRSLVMRDGKFL